MQSIRGERRTGVRRTRRKMTLAVIVLGILGVSYLWQVSRQKSEALNPEKFSSEAGNLRFILEEGHKSKSNHGELLHSTVAMLTNQSNIKEEVHLKEVVPLKSRNESKTLSSSSPIASPVKLFSQEKISPNSTVSRGIHIKNGAGWREDLKRNITNVSGLNRDGPSVRMPSRSKEEVENGKNKQVGEGREVESLRTEEVKKTQLAPYVQNENHTTIRESFQNKSRDTTLLNLMHNNESVTSFMMTGGYNYTEPRYSFSPAGQFQLQTFVKELANFSKNPTFENSLFNVSDKIRLILLSKGEIREIYSITHHPKLKLVAFDTPMSLSYIVPIESCPVCGTVKSPDDINEVFAFHVDRVLRINRALPVSARLFQDIELENLNLEGDEDRDQPRPVMWFAKDLTHGGKFQTDQNSFQLNWRTYQEILSGCHEKANLTRAINCTEINYSEWSRMAVLDFVMQNHDRLDRYCCGYNEIDEGEACFRNEVMYEIEGCDDIENRYLVHILTTKSNPHQLILLDNSGNLHRSKEHLNFEILKGIRTIPKEVMEMIYSENLQDRLLESLKWDSVYWKSMGEENIKQQAQIISERLDLLKDHIKACNITAI